MPSQTSPASAAAPAQSAASRAQLHRTWPASDSRRALSNIVPRHAPLQWASPPTGDRGLLTASAVAAAAADAAADGLCQLPAAALMSPLHRQAAIGSKWDDGTLGGSEVMDIEWVWCTGVDCRESIRVTSSSD